MNETSTILIARDISKHQISAGETAVKKVMALNLCVCVCVCGGGWGRSQLEDEPSVHVTREGVSVWFTGKFRGSAVGPVRSGFKKGLI